MPPETIRLPLVPSVSVMVLPAPASTWMVVELIFEMVILLAFAPTPVLVINNSTPLLARLTVPVKATGLTLLSRAIKSGAKNRERGLGLFLDFFRFSQEKDMTSAS